MLYGHEWDGVLYKQGVSSMWTPHKLNQKESMFQAFT